MLLVHAHPDDETISTGGTIATLLDAGARVTLLTCTRGERGEVVPPELQHLSGDALGAYRERELASAMRVLGLADHRILGSEDACANGTEPHRYRDSGMKWGPDGAEPLSETGDGTSLTDAGLDAVVADIVSVIDEVRPTAVVSYDERGGYGHPDHIRAHDAASMAALLTDTDYFTIVPSGQESPGDIRVDVRAVMERKRLALAEHRTQLSIDGDTIVHSGGQREPIGEVESFRPRRAADDPGVNWARLGVPLRITACVVALVLGGIVGAIGTANHQYTWAVTSLALTAPLLAGLRFLFATRIVAGFAAVGLLGVVWMFSQTGPGGSILVPANLAGYVWAYGPLVLAFVGLAWPQPGTFTRATMGTGPEPGKDVEAQ